MKVITLASDKGGQGKTSTSLFLGQAFRFRGLKVLLIDLDSNTSLTQFLQDHFSVSQIKIEAKNIVRAMQGRHHFSRYIIKTNSGIDFVPAKSDVKNISRDFFDDPAIRSRFANNIRALDYDIVILDCHNEINLGMTCAFYASDLVLCPLELGIWSTQSVKKIMEETGKIEQLVNRRIEVRPFISKVTKKDSEELLQMGKDLKFDMCITPILRDKTIGTATDMSSFLNEKSGNAFKWYSGLAEELLR